MNPTSGAALEAEDIKLDHAWPVDYRWPNTHCCHFHYRGIIFITYKRPSDTWDKIRSVGTGGLTRNLVGFLGTLPHLPPM